MVLVCGVLVLGAVAAVLLTRRGQTGVDVPVPTDLESFDPQITAYLKKYIQRAQSAPRDFDAQATLGMVYGANSVWREARACFANAVLLRPNEPLARHHEAIATDELGEADTAFEMFGQLAREFPEFTPGRHRYGAGLLFRGRLEDAAAEFERLIALAPSAPEGYIGLGEVRLREGDPAASGTTLAWLSLPQVGPHRRSQAASFRQRRYRATLSDGFLVPRAAATRVGAGRPD